MFRNYLDSSFDNGCGFNVPGGNSIYLINRYSISGTTITAGKLDSISASTGWIRFEKVDGLNYETKSQFTRSGWIYTTEISFVVPEIRVMKNRLFDYLKEDVTAIFQDRTGQFWCIGLNQTCNITTYDYDSNTGEYNVKLTSTHKNKLVPVSSAVVNILQIADYDVCNFSLTGIKELSVLKTGWIENVVVRDDKVVRIEVSNYPLELKNLDDIYYKVTPRNTKNGITNQIQVGFTVDQISQDKNELLEKLTNSQLVFIATDKNGKTWLIGYPNPLLLSDAGFGTTDANYQYVFSASQKQNILEINKDAFNIVDICDMQYFDSEYIDCDYIE